MADTENRLAVLAVAARPGRCPQTADVCASGGEPVGILLCDLELGHKERLHYDSADGIWWTRDAEAGRG